MTEVLPWRYAINKPVVTIPKVCVALATHELVPAGFMFSLAKMSAHTVANMDADGSELGLTMVKGTYVHSARQQLLEKAIKDKVTHILWVDTDMTFPKDALLRLLAHNVPVVGINYCQRGEPYEFVAIKKVGWGENESSQKLITNKHSTGLEEVDAVGFGMVLMKMDIMSCLPPLDGPKPWFGFDWINGRKQVGEDVRFCKMLKDGGHRIFVDHDLSKECGHIGQFEYITEHAVALSNENVQKTAAL